mmetsp:Transcript_24741/g.69263  ORF Transcript_24741/g.69263 Transcript_24741/m.69263 type:complete len:612 (+) Transcript_24741:137-1972(+)
MSHLELLEMKQRSGSVSREGSSGVRYVVVSGGTMSGIGKGVVASSTGMIMRRLGFKVTSIKIDPYLNIDAGTMSPFEHGEVFVLNDGGEVDLDLGNYERFIGISLARDNNITTGKIYNHVIEKERRGDYLGKTVQVVPHVVGAIQEWIEKVAAANGAEVCVIELGGTVGDIESGPFIEALRQLQFRVGVQNMMNLHVALVPMMGVVGEQKTKPIQQSVRALRASGLFPDLVICRSSQPLQTEPRRKIAYFSQIREENVLSCADVPNLYHVPLNLVAQRLDYLILHRLNLLPKTIPDWSAWRTLATTVDDLSALPETETVRVAIVGKYTGLQDSYLSLIKALKHASIHERIPFTIDWVEASCLEEEGAPDDPAAFERSWETVRGADAILVPGGFGDRGVEGKINAIRFARMEQYPFLGICLGMQLAVVEYCRSILKLPEANSEEFNGGTPHRVIIFMPEISTTHMGGTMRLGQRTTHFVKKHLPASKVSALYAENAAAADEFGITVTTNAEGHVTAVDERHRHRYEVNPEYAPKVEAAGLLFTGVDDRSERMEVIELPTHPYFVGTQYHPEFQSRPQWPSPPFVGFLRAARQFRARNQKRNKEQQLQHSHEE